MPLSRRIVDAGPAYARLARIVTRFCGAAVVVLGVGWIALTMQNFHDPLVADSLRAQHETLPWMLVPGLLLIALGACAWPLASGGSPWRIFDVVMVDPFKRPAPERPRAWNVILWWESRRPFYNLVVGTAGLLSGIVALTAGGFSESRGGEAVGIPDGGVFMIAAVVLFGVGANACYTGGWVVELVARRWGRSHARFGAWAFAGGLAFSVALAFAPAILAVSYLIALLMGWVRPGVGGPE